MDDRKTRREAQRAALAAAMAPSEPRPRSPLEKACKAITDVAKTGQVFSLRDLKAQHPELEVDEVPQALQHLVRLGVIKRIARGQAGDETYIDASQHATETPEDLVPTAEDAKDPLIKCLDTPRTLRDLSTMLASSEASVRAKASRIIKRGDITSRKIYGRLFFARTQADFDRFEADYTPPLHRCAQMILNLLPEDGAVEQLLLTHHLDVCAPSVQRRVNELARQGAIENFKMGTSRYVILTDIGRVHPCREPEEDLLPAAEWSSSRHASQIGVLIIMDIMQQADVSDLAVGMSYLPDAFQVDNLSVQCANMRISGLLEFYRKPGSTDLRGMRLGREAMAKMPYVRRLIDYPSPQAVKEAIQGARAIERRTARQEARSLKAIKEARTAKITQPKRSRTGRWEPRLGCRG